MNFYPVWPYFASTALLLLLASTPLFQWADTPPSPTPPSPTRPSSTHPRRNRIVTLDGLRGFLALAVVFHHAAYYHLYLRDGLWRLTDSPFHLMLGQAGVSVFFMITGYLFWSQILGNGGRLSWVRFYIGRVFRIAPVYVLAILAMFVLALLETGFRPEGPPLRLLGQLLSWSTLGAISGQDINGYPGTRYLLAGVTWTLSYEWRFYLCLPLLALAARRPRLHLPCVAAGLAANLVWVLQTPGQIQPVLSCLFLVGMACASLHRHGLVLRIPDPAASLLVAVLVTATFTGFADGYTDGPIILLGIAFYLVASGCTLAGLLTSRPARRLGDISYGIYLLQGPALYIALRPAPLRNLALAQPAFHWLLVFAAALLLVATATIVHTLVERPGIALGSRLAARWLSLRASRLAPPPPGPLPEPLLESTTRNPPNSPAGH